MNTTMLRASVADAIENELAALGTSNSRLQRNQRHARRVVGILGTVADYSDPAAYRNSAERARRFGFSGGTCIHPGLVGALNEAFMPTADEVAYAQKLIAADEKAAAEGRGSFSVDGKMIDIPVIDRARRLLQRHEAIDKRLKR